MLVVFATRARIRSRLFEKERRCFTRGMSFFLPGIGEAPRAPEQTLVRHPEGLTGDRIRRAEAVHGSGDLRLLHGDAPVRPGRGGRGTLRWSRSGPCRKGL
jgi:hypothetical protein